MELSLNSIQVGYVIWTLIGVVIGLVLSRLGPSRRRAAVAVAELGQARAEIATRDARIAQLERDVAASRDQVRPLSDEVDRLRRENAKRVTTSAPVAPAAGLDMTAPAMMGGVIEPAPVMSTEPLPAFLDAPRGTADNLTLMKGVGDRFAARLNEIGVFHYRQIAGWSPADVGIADAKLDTFRGRIERDQLVEQAKLLAAGRTTEYEARFGKIGGDAAPLA